MTKQLNRREFIKAALASGALLLMPRWLPPTKEQIRGCIGQVRIYSRALTPDEVLQLLDRERWWDLYQQKAESSFAFWDNEEDAIYDDL